MSILLPYKNKYSFGFVLLSLFLIIACHSRKKYDLVIKNASILDVRTGEVARNKTILISRGLILDIVNNDESYEGNKVIDANNDLVTPGLIDTHIHPTDIFGDYDKAPKTLSTDSLKFLREQLSNQYLPFGTTTVLTMGQPESWIQPLISWQKKSQPGLVDFYLAGGALISKDNRVPYIGHTEVVSPVMVRQKINYYDSLGIHYLKVYYRLREPEFSTAIQLAKELNMKVYGHIGDFNPGYLTMQETLKKGLLNYEHLATLPNSIITSDKDWEVLIKQFNSNFGELASEASIMKMFLEQFRFIDSCKRTEVLGFIDRMAKNKVTFSTTIHRIYEQFEPTYFTTPKDSTLTIKQYERCMENFQIMMKYLKIMNDKGVIIRLGSDMPNGGKVNISELKILNKYGINVAGVFKIATLNGAVSMGIDDEVGIIEKGKKANLIIWENNPFDNPENFATKIKVIKDGKVVKN